MCILKSGIFLLKNPCRSARRPARHSKMHMHSSLKSGKGADALRNTPEKCASYCGAGEWRSTVSVGLRDTPKCTCIPRSCVEKGADALRNTLKCMHISPRGRAKKKIVVDSRELRYNPVICHG